METQCFTYSVCIALVRILRILARVALWIMDRARDSCGFSEPTVVRVFQKPQRMCSGAVRAAVTSIFEDEGFLSGISEDGTCERVSEGVRTPSSSRR